MPLNVRREFVHKRSVCVSRSFKCFLTKSARDQRVVTGGNAKRWNSVLQAVQVKQPVRTHGKRDNGAPEIKRRFPLTPHSQPSPLLLTRYNAEDFYIHECRPVSAGLLVGGLMSEHLNSHYQIDLFRRVFKRGRDHAF
jgi:hypothetical protein